MPGHRGIFLRVIKDCLANHFQGAPCAFAEIKGGINASGGTLSKVSSELSFFPRIDSSAHFFFDSLPNPGNKSPEIF